MSIVGVILLIYVSPLTITCALFERTKGIFENWWKQMLGFILQPMILFAYLGLLLTVFDDLFIGDAKFKPGTNGAPTIDCTSNAIANTNPNENSVYCILNLAKYKNYTGLELFDLALPVLTSLNKEKINTLSRAAIVMFVFLKFLDKITTVAKKLVGGVELKDDSTSNLQNQFKKVAKGVQTRALNATARIATKHGANYIKKKIRPDDIPPPKTKKESENAKKTEGDGSSPAGDGDSAGGGKPPASDGGKTGGGDDGVVD
jgi:type IV secretion system protein VirB6